MCFIGVTAFDELAYTSGLTFPSGTKEWCPTITVLDLHISLVIETNVETGHFAPLRRHMQSCHTCSITMVYINSMGWKIVKDVEMATSGGTGMRGSIIVVEAHNVGSRIDQITDRFTSTIGRGFEQR